MDSSLFRGIDVQRGFHYQYYHAPAQPGRPTLLLLHGFPSNAYEWRRQVAYFQPKGYGILVPDLLGAGKTSRPLDLHHWRTNLMAADIIEILDAEGLDKVIGVSHDWGSQLLSRLAILYSERFLAFGWLGLPFMEPRTEPFVLEEVMAQIKQILGYEGYAYWEFFVSEDAAEIIEKNIESFLQLLYPKDPGWWVEYLGTPGGTPGKTAEWMELNIRPGYPDYMTKDDLDKMIRSLREDGGIRSALNWYHAAMQNIDLDDNRKLDKAEWKIKQPNFFAVALRDCICTSVLGRVAVAQYCPVTKSVEFDTGHWPQLEAADDVNRELELWFESLET